jgi:hypothetical protein
MGSTASGRAYGLSSVSWANAWCYEKAREGGGTVVGERPAHGPSDWFTPQSNLQRELWLRVVLMPPSRYSASAAGSCHRSRLQTAQRQLQPSNTDGQATVGQTTVYPPGHLAPKPISAGSMCRVVQHPEPSTLTGSAVTRGRGVTRVQQPHLSTPRTNPARTQQSDAT